MVLHAIIFVQGVLDWRSFTTAHGHALHEVTVEEMSNDKSGEDSDDEHARVRCSLKTTPHPITE